ncbi:MAG: Ig-like domain-containing protein [Erysipelotrichaceae bacterium]|nr:Ig-like domain-containing protein [Erysipelotrichaceae bacterium]
MHQTSLHKISVCLTGLLFILFACCACHTDASYFIGDYLNDLALKSGIGSSDDLDDNFERLYKWGVVERSEASLFDRQLDYDYLSLTICRLIELEGDPLESLENCAFISSDVRGKDRVNEETADKVIAKAVRYLNHQEISRIHDYEFCEEPLSDEEALEEGSLLYKDDTYYLVEKDSEEGMVRREAAFDEVFESLDLEESGYIDFEKAIIIPYGEEYEDTSYINEYYTLLSSNGSHVFHNEGFRISYSLNASGIDLHLSRDENGLNVYLDVSIRNVKPVIRWHSRKNDLKNCFFTLSFNTCEKLGISTGKYRNYHLKFKDLDPSSFMSLLHSLIEPQSEAQEASIPICRIKVPIPEIPTACIDLDVLVKFYASGKTEFVLNSSNQIGFETKNGQIRYINEEEHDLNSILQASAKATLGLNCGLEIAKTKLTDLQLDTGIKGLVRSTLHLYDEEGDLKSVASVVPYSGLNELSDGNPDVLVCGDVSLHWLMDLIVNTPSSKMYSLGFTRSFSIMDEEDQVFNNLHHIENGHFVEKCTRKKRETVPQMQEVKIDRIVLDSYAEVLKKGETHQITIRSLPETYQSSDIIYESSDASIASVCEGLVKGIREGSARIEVRTKDGKYKSYVNILVSTG